MWDFSECVIAIVIVIVIVIVTMLRHGMMGITGSVMRIRKAPKNIARRHVSPRRGRDTPTSEHMPHARAGQVHSTEVVDDVDLGEAVMIKKTVDVPQTLFLDRAVATLEEK